MSATNFNTKNDSVGRVFRALELRIETASRQYPSDGPWPCRISSVGNGMRQSPHAQAIILE